MVLSLSGCVTVVPNTTVCTVAGELRYGALCVTTLSGQRTKLNLDELITMLEPLPEASGVPARAGAIIQTAEDFNKVKTALEQACRRLGRRCSYEAKHAIERMSIAAQELGAP